MKRFTKAILPVLLLSTGVSGCSAAADYSTLRINSKGGLTQTIVEDWDQEQYDKNELETQITSDIASYGSAVQLDSIKVKDSSIVVRMTYADTDTYTAYNGVPLFEGSIAACQAAGYLLEGEFKNADGEAMDRTEVLNFDDTCTVLVFQEPVEVTVPGKIISYTSSLEMTGKRSVKAVQDEGSEEILLSAPVYVIYK